VVYLKENTMSTIITHIQGIPCKAKMTYYSPARSARVYGPPEDCYEAEDAEVDFTILDRRGRSAAWLEKKMTDDDVFRIEGELIEAAEEEKYCDASR
jgi:hypothetical protein